MITRYVNTASTAGGDGTTNNTVGADRAFATLGEAATQLATLNAADDVDLRCEGSTIDDSVTSFTGTYVQSGFTFTIRGNQVGGIFNNLKYTKQTDSGANENGIFIDTRNSAQIFRIVGVQFLQTVTNSISLHIYTNSTAIVTMDSCIVKVVASSIYYTVWGRGSSHVLNILNCVVADVGNTPRCVGIGLSAPGIVRNTLIRGFVFGHNTSAGCDSKNCIVFDNGTDFAGSGNVDHAASDDGNGSNPIAIPYWAPQFASTSYAADVDFRLRSTSSLVQVGVGPSIDPLVPATDIIGNARSGATASVGPFENGVVVPPITRYVNTASTAGGDGTTNGTAGATRAYATLQEAATQMTSLNAAEHVEVQCCGSAIDTSGPYFLGLYVQAGFTLTIRGNPTDPNGANTSGIYDSSKYRLRCDAVIDGYAFNSSTPQKFKLYQVQGYVSSTSLGVYERGASMELIVDRCVFAYSDQLAIIWQRAANSKLTVTNCVMSKDTVDTPGSSPIIYVKEASGSTATVYNSIFSGGCGIVADGSSGASTVVCKNTVVLKSSLNFNPSSGSIITVDHCAGDDNSGTNPVTVSSWDAQFYSPTYRAGTDYRLKNTSVLLNAGVGPSVDVLVPTTDVVGTARVGSTASLGPFEDPVSSPTRVIVVVIG
jgi:hypothetical protein